ncbi:response regulator [Tautonia plasticadhaerens]|uniref:DNA-binding response regulator MtrA n=1 Tax=Tautonia plasticadhaerens TaxID=2527974 RepID=A0A518GWD8_9BACT|nr:response regulator [Tautonia plasticadhaerens]QDV32912.1 DNA-binding response regulator MtrA [Tautonia plasticadhaerens]
MSVPPRLAVLGITTEDVEAIRGLDGVGGGGVEVCQLSEEVPAEVVPARTDAIVLAHGPPEVDAMRWLPRLTLAGTVPVVVLSAVKDDREAERLRRAGAFAVVHRGSGEGLGRAIRRALERSAALTRESDLRRMAGLVGVIGGTLKDELGGIRNAIEVLSFQCSGEGVLSQRRAIEYLDRQCRRMESLLNDYSEASRLGADSIEVGSGMAELGASLDRAIERAREDAGGGTPSISRAHRPDRHWLRVSPRRLEQLVRHGLNFVRGSNPGCQELRVETRDYRDGIELAIRAVPQGAGGSPSMLRSADLDLILASMLSDRIGARLESRTPFLLLLPRSLDGRSGATRGAGPDPAAGEQAGEPRRRLLMIDDHPATVEVLGRLISRRGWDVRVTPDVHEALEMIRDLRPEVVLIDLQMPAMKGDALARLIRRDHADVRPMLIGVSGSAGSPGEEAALSWFDHVLFKPVRSDQVAALLPPPAARPGPPGDQARAGSLEGSSGSGRWSIP